MLYLLLASKIVRRPDDRYNAVVVWSENPEEISSIFIKEFSKGFSTKAFAFFEVLPVVDLLMRAKPFDFKLSDRLMTVQNFELASLSSDLSLLKHINYAPQI